MLQGQKQTSSEENECGCAQPPWLAQACRPLPNPHWWHTTLPTCCLRPPECVLPPPVPHGLLRAQTQQQVSLGKETRQQQHLSHPLHAQIQQQAYPITA